MSDDEVEKSELARGGAFYDRPRVFDRYRASHERVSDPTYGMELPAVLEKIGDAASLRVVDLGCGDATIALRLFAAGAQAYLGVDGSARMVETAQQTLAGSPGRVVAGDIEDFSVAPTSFDLVLSRLALHYVERVDAVFDACYSCLRPGGRIVFTVIHPVISSHDARASTDELRGNWVVDDYFDPGPRDQRWLGATVRWYHRTIEDYVHSLRTAGFQITVLRECPPKPQAIPDADELRRRRRIPLFLLLAGTRT